MNFARILLSWYASNGRNLPWRNTRNPYEIWVSEIILQQTRVNQGIQYYFKFLAKFPTLAHLANAPLSALHHVWQGLGYYNRAINMHRAAGIIHESYAGGFPEQFDHWLSLPGVGPYTAAAIVSSAFNYPVAAIDTNGYRVISRIFAIDEGSITKNKKLVQQWADKLLDKDNPGVFNQAIMDFGAMVCKSSNPGCASCVFSKECKAFLSGIPEKFPAKTKPKLLKKRYFYYFKLISTDSAGIEKFLFYQRQNDDVWKFLYELPLVETAKACTIEEFLNLPRLPEWIGLLPPARTWVVSKPLNHTLTHQLIEARLVTIKWDHNQQIAGNGRFLMLGLSQFGRLPTHRLMSKLLAGEPKIQYRVENEPPT